MDEQRQASRRVAMREGTYNRAKCWRSCAGWGSALFTAVWCSVLSAGALFEDDPAYSLQLLEPGPTGKSTHNQRDNAMPFAVSIRDADAVVAPGRHAVRGIARGMRNVAVVCPAGGPWTLTQPGPDGTFSVSVDFPDVLGPLSIEVYAWDSPPNDPNFRFNIDARIDLFVTGAPDRARDPTNDPHHPAAGMTLVWSDEFDGLSSSSSQHQDATWFAGGKPSADSQYSDAFFVSATDRRNPFLIKDGFLRIRATHVPKDPAHPGPLWWSGHLSTGFPDESASLEFRRGYAEVRMKTPVGSGAWPAFWLLDSASTQPSRTYGAVEIDAVESYGGFPAFYMTTEHRWPGATPDGPHAFVTHKIERPPEQQEGFHTYGVRLTDTEVIWYYDAREVDREPLYRAEVVSPFFLMIDLAIGGGWPIAVPPSNAYDLWIDYVRVYE